MGNRLLPNYSARALLSKKPHVFKVGTREAFHLWKSFSRSLARRSMTLAPNPDGTEIENLAILQGVGSSEVKGVLPRKREVRPVGIEPTTLDLGKTQLKTTKPLLIKHFAIYETASLHKAYTRIFKLNKSSKLLIKRKTQEESQKPRGN